MKYTNDYDKDRLMIKIRGEPEELSQCAMAILKVTEGYSALRTSVRNKFSVKSLSDIVVPEVMLLGEYQKEQMVYSPNEIRFSYVPDSNAPEAVSNAAKNHYNSIVNVLADMKESSESAFRNMHVISLDAIYIRRK